MPKVELFFDLSGSGATTTPGFLTDDFGTVLTTDTGDPLVITASTAGFFILGHPVLGLLGGVGVLAGNLATDVSRYVMSVSTNRGRSQQFDETQTGTATITLRNDTRVFDPSNLASPYAGNIRPGKKVRVALNERDIYTGKIDDWSFGYDVNGASTATITCVDALASLAAISMTEWVTTPQATGARVSAVLDRGEVGFPYSRNVDTGASRLQGDTIGDGTNVLSYLQTVNRAELGHLFDSKSGVLTFLDRSANANQAATVFADDGTGIKFSALEVSYGTELLYTSSIVSRVGGSTETFTDDDASQEFGVRTITMTDMLFDSDDQSEAFGQFLISRYAEPQQRLASLTSHLPRLTATERWQLLELELGDVVDFTFTPEGTGSAISQECLLEGVAHDIRPGEWDTTLRFGDVTARFVFTLGDPVYGLLGGTAVLSF